MKSLYLLMFAFFIASTRLASAQVIFNGDFEKIDNTTKFPAGWKNPGGNYEFKVDSNTVQQGKYALSIAAKAGTAGSGATVFVIPQTFKGKQIQLKGYMKTENAAGGWAGLWLRVDGASGNIAFNNMNSQSIQGTTDWKEYTITLFYDDERAIAINLGGLLVGSGKMWIDNIRLYIDGKPIEQAQTKKIVPTKASQDLTFSKGSTIAYFTPNQQQIQNLSLLAQAWGFIKYHHPTVAKGDFNMDAELFRALPAVIKAQSNKEANDAIELWVDKFGVPQHCDNCKPYAGNDIAQKPEYGQLFDRSIVSAALADKLTYILDNRNTGKNYYVGMVFEDGNPEFTNEAPYTAMTYPDAGYRLLALFRYWNMIQYFYPYKYTIDGNWITVLSEFIPQFAAAKDATEYDLAVMRLISTIHDTHAGMLNSMKALEDYRGKYALPFEARFVEDKLVVTAYYNDTLAVKEKLKIGDVITSINGVQVANLIKKYLPITSASNYSTQLHFMSRYYLLRSNDPNFKFDISRDGKAMAVNMAAIANDKVNYRSLSNPMFTAPAYTVLENNIGYLYPAKYYDKNLPEIKKMFASTKGIIIDMRCYPSNFMPFTFVPFIKKSTGPFVKFTHGNVANPGLFTYTKPVINKGENGFKGKVVVIVNEETISQAEYTTMAFQSSPNVTVIGSITEGADGNVSAITFPGGGATTISGLNVLYPDGTETQHKGVRIDEQVKQTINGIKAGRDELLERAKAIIMAN